MKQRDQWKCWETVAGFPAPPDFSFCLNQLNLETSVLHEGFECVHYRRCQCLPPCVRWEAERIAGLIYKLTSGWPWSEDAPVGAASSAPEHSPVPCSTHSPAGWLLPRVEPVGTAAGKAGRASAERTASRHFVEQLQPAPQLPHLFRFADNPKG